MAAPFLKIVQLCVKNCTAIVKKYLEWHCHTVNHFPAQCRGLMMSLQYGLAKSFCAVTQCGGEGLFHSFGVVSKTCGPATSTADRWAAVMPTTETDGPIPSFLQIPCLQVGKWVLVLDLTGTSAHLSPLLISPQIIAWSARAHSQQ